MNTHLSFSAYARSAKENKMTLKKLCEKIISLENLNPSKGVNFLFEELVHHATTQKKETSQLLPIKQKKLWLVCAKAESLLEKYWAEKITSLKVSLSDFPYFQNYKDLTRIEWYTLQGCTEHKNHRILFVGSGPLPLTAILLAKEYGANVTIMEIDKEVCEISQKLINTLGLSKKIKVINENGAHYAGYKRFNVIFVAALAGTTAKCKHSIFKKIKTSGAKGCHVIARTSHGKRKILYNPLTQSAYCMLKPVIQIDPHNNVINSILVLRV